MKRSSDRKRDSALGQALLTLRTALGLTQGELAEQLGVSRQTVGKWEVGGSYPKVEYLKQVVALGVQRQVLPAEHGSKEIYALWQAAHQEGLPLADQTAPDKEYPPSSPDASPLAETDDPELVEVAPGPQIDWREALAVSSFYGREQEVALLTQWVLQEHCRVVSVLGMGGIGKSALVVSVMYRLATHFEIAIFRSLRDAPSCEVLLDGCLQVLSPQPLGIMPTNLERRLSLLLDHLRKVRTLIVLDNLEAILEEGEVKGRFRPGYEGYGQLLRRVGEATHQSCLLLTSREKPANIELRRLEGKQAPVRVLSLSGLSTAACEQLFAEKELLGSPQDRAQLVEQYAGNPLALKIVAEIIADLFGGEIGPFLTEGPVIFGGIADLLAEQLVRLSPLEQTILRWLAIAREPVTLDELMAMLVVPLPRIQMLEALESLRRRSLIERGQRPASFTLQAVVLEYITTVLIKEISHDLLQQQLQRLIPYGLTQASAREYIRQTQVRLLVAPIIVSLQSAYHGRVEVEELLLSLLDQCRGRADAAQGYGPANLVVLLKLQRGHLRGIDLSQLVIRGAYLQGVEMQDTQLCEALVRDTIFTEALDAIWVVAISRTGQYWATGSRRGEVRVWSEGGQSLHLVWQAHSDNTFTLAFSPDERMLATGSWDGTVKLWDVQNGALLWTGWHTGFVFSVAFAPDGQILASGGADALVRLWDMPSGKQVQALASQGGQVYSLAWSPDGCLLASGGFDGRIQLWQVQAGTATCIRMLVGHSNWIHSLAFAPDSSQLASGSWDSMVKLWDIASGQVRQTLAGHTQRVYSVAWSPNGGTVASASLDGTIRLWDVIQNRYYAALHGHTAAVYHLAFTPDSCRLLSGSQDRTIRVWEVAGGQCLRTIEGYAVSFYDLAWSPDGRWLACAGSDLLVTLWQATGEARPRELRGHNWIVYGVAWSPDGRLLASSGWDNTIRLWEPTTGACLQVLQDPDHGDTLFHCVAWSPDGRLLACGSYLYGVQVWDMRTNTQCWVGRQHRSARHVVWSPDGTQLASSGDDGICLWEASHGILLKKLQVHQGSMVKSLAWSPDGRRLVSGGGGRDGGEVLVWEMTSEGQGKLVQAWRGLAGEVFAVAWSPNGEVLVSGDSEGKLQWWEVESGACLVTREGHVGIIQVICVNPDGNVLASSGDDSTIRLWDLRSGEMLHTLRRDRPYERLNITGIRGLTEAQKATLRALGAIEEKTLSQTAPGLAKN